MCLAFEEHIAKPLHFTFVPVIFATLVPSLPLDEETVQ